MSTYFEYSEIGIVSFDYIAHKKSSVDPGSSYEFYKKFYSILLRFAAIAFQQRTAIIAPIAGPTTIIQKSPQASGQNTAGPKLRAGFTEQLSTGIPTIFTKPRAKPIAKPENLPNPFAGSVAPRMTKTKKNVRSPSANNAMPDVAPG